MRKKIGQISLSALTLLTASLASLLLGVNSYASSAKEIPCGTVDGVQYTAKQSESFSKAWITGYQGDSKFVVEVTYVYALGRHSGLVEQDGHKFIYRPYVYVMETGATQEALLNVDGTELNCN
jgi:hypothetical protein